jgi:hypothetical protein
MINRYVKIDRTNDMTTTIAITATTIYIKKLLPDDVILLIRITKAAIRIILQMIITIHEMVGEQLYSLLVTLRRVLLTTEMILMGHKMLAVETAENVIVNIGVILLRPIIMILRDITVIIIVMRHCDRATMERVRTKPATLIPRLPVVVATATWIRPHLMIEHSLEHRVTIMTSEAARAEIMTTRTASPISRYHLGMVMIIRSTIGTATDLRRL